MQPKAKILLVEDDSSLGFVIKDNLEENGYEVIFSSDGESGWQQFMRHNVDICLLDVMLPKKDGMALAAQIRKKNEKIPILFLTAKSMDEDRIAGFKAGGDDYITKPFNMEELLLRIEVFLKRTRKKANEGVERFELGKLEFDYNNLLLIDGAHKQQLTQKEADLLQYLCLHTNTVVKREDILLNVWGKEDYFLGRSMDVFMTKIRKYLRDVEGVELQTVHGVGFKLVLQK
ncbi:response regulator transcription factor [Taibaiella chishuiensis]|uniref:DNA-binding response OmpR family regulator n=1 Tax=Taibaiella chishuiensis TaxID=1434707 RepID=A0A2P8DBV7_9BACT|nr:response regulator transcription factor [Taibaiella chishuiensis]PSK94684.1 DNA-binding response OmpR family regulator [Taibaiella chishuiensis]